MNAVRNKSKGKSLYSGYLLAFEPKRTDKIAEQLDSGRDVSESFSAMDWKFERREIVLLSLSQSETTIGGVALMERKHGTGGTGKLMMRLFNSVIIDNPITADELLNVFDLNGNTSTAERLIRIDSFSWQSLINAIRKLRPLVADQIDELISERELDRHLMGDSSRVLCLMEQRDAIGLTLDVAGLDRKSVLRAMKVSNVENATSALDLLDHEPLQEQDVMRHDQQIFSGMLIDDMRKGRFSSQSGREVRVYVYDKKPLETVLGIDLLIYQESYKSYLLLQYKIMKPIQGKHGGSSWSYSVNEQIRKQIDAMDKGMAAIQRQSVGVGGLMEWRLNSEPFYFKFCETTRPNARDDALIAGITLGHEHLKCFLALPESEGKNGKGRHVGYENCHRYLNNSQFIELVREGWIGCDQQGYSLITEVLRANKENGKQAMLAVIAGNGATNALERGWQHKNGR